MEKDQNVPDRKRKRQENDSDSKEELDLGHLNHTFDDSDYSTDCSACERTKLRKKMKLNTANGSESEGNDKAVEEDKSAENDNATKSVIIQIFKIF